MLKDWLVGNEGDLSVERQLQWKGAGVVHASGASILAWVEVGFLCWLLGNDVLPQWQGAAGCRTLSCGPGTLA